MNFTAYSAMKYRRGDGMLRTKRFGRALEGNVQCLLNLCEKE